MEDYIKKFVVMIDLAMIMEEEIKNTFFDLTITERRNALMPKYFSIYETYPGVFDNALELNLREKNKTTLDIISKYRDEPWKLRFLFCILSLEKNIEDLKKQSNLIQAKGVTLQMQEFYYSTLDSLETLLITVTKSLEKCKNFEQVQKNLIDICISGKNGDSIYAFLLEQKLIPKKCDWKLD
jgi:hypothetical protein